MGAEQPQCTCSGTFTHLVIPLRPQRPEHRLGDVWRQPRQRMLYMEQRRRTGPRPEAGASVPSTAECGSHQQLHGLLAHGAAVCSVCMQVANATQY